jgi:hypothetical protein
MSKRSQREINAEQRAGSRECGTRPRNRRRPSRDDLARMLLWKMIMSAGKHRLGRREALDRLRDEIVDGLELQGFDVRESEEVFEELAGRYADGLFPISSEAASQANMISSLLAPSSKPRLIQLICPPPITSHNGVCAGIAKVGFTATLLWSSLSAIRIKLAIFTWWKRHYLNLSGNHFCFAPPIRS